MKNKAVSLLISYLIVTVGCIIYSITFDWFYVPNGIAYGGLTGLGQIIHQVFPKVGIGIVVLLMNIPLFAAGWARLGGHMLISSLYATALTSVLIDLFDSMMTFPETEPLLASLYGGVFLGISLGLIFREGATTGGTDIGARLLKCRFSWVPTGQLLMILDLAVICAVALAFGNLDSALYGVVALAVSTIVMDKVLYGLDNTKVAYVITGKPESVGKAIMDEMDRGLTVLHGMGGYSREDKDILLVAFPERQIAMLKRIIKGIDPTAFVIVCQASEVLGDGFRKNEEQN